VQPDRPAADSDQPLSAVDLALALHTGPVGGDVFGAGLRGITGPICFFPARKSTFQPDTPDTMLIFNGYFGF
jgi:hypothetical protein